MTPKPDDSIELLPCPLEQSDPELANFFWLVAHGFHRTVKRVNQSEGLIVFTLWNGRHVVKRTTPSGREG